MEHNNYEYEEIDLLELFTLLLKKWYVIAIFVIVSVVGAYFYIDYQKPVYASEASFIIEVGNANSEYSDILMGQKLASTYKEIIYSENVLGQVKEKTAGNYTVEELRKIISVTTPSDSLVVKISAQTNSPGDSYTIVNETQKLTLEFSGEFGALNRAYLLDPAEIDTEAEPVNKVMYYAVALVLGGALGSFAVLMKKFMNNKIVNEDDISKFLNQKLLVSIPKHKLK